MKVWKAGVVGIVLSVSLLAGLPEKSEICTLLESLSGWSKSNQCEGMQISGPMGEVLSVSQQYTRGDASLELAVVSGMQAMMMWGTYGSGMTMENDESLVKVEKIGGFNVGITYNKKERSGAVVVQLTPQALLAGNFENMDWNEALKTMKELDWQKLAELFK